MPVLTPQELDELTRAKALLDKPGFAARLAGMLGRPIEQGFKLLPSGWQSVVNRAAKAALLTALSAAVKGLSSVEIQTIVAASQAGAISRETMLKLFWRGEVLPEGRSNEEEQKLIAAASVVNTIHTHR